MEEHYHVTVRQEPGCIVETVETVETHREGVNAVHKLADGIVDTGSIHVSWHRISDGYVMVTEYGHDGYTIISASWCVAGACGVTAAHGR